MACAGCAAGVGCQTKTGGACAAPSFAANGTFGTYLLGDIGPSTGARLAPRFSPLRGPRVAAPRTGCKTCGGRKKFVAPVRGLLGPSGPSTGHMVVDRERFPLTAEVHDRVLEAYSNGQIEQALGILRNVWQRAITDGQLREVLQRIWNEAVAGTAGPAEAGGGGQPQGQLLMCTAAPPDCGFYESLAEGSPGYILPEGSAIRAASDLDRVVEEGWTAVVVTGPTGDIVPGYMRSEVLVPAPAIAGDTRIAALLGSPRTGQRRRRFYCDLQGGCPVRSGLGETASVVGTIPFGDEVLVTRRAGPFAYVRYPISPTPLVGWVPASTLREERMGRPYSCVYGRCPARVFRGEYVHYAHFHRGERATLHASPPAGRTVPAGRVYFTQPDGTEGYVDPRYMRAVRG